MEGPAWSMAYHVRCKIADTLYCSQSLRENDCCQNAEMLVGQRCSMDDGNCAETIMMRASAWCARASACCVASKGHQRPGPSPMICPEERGQELPTARFHILYVPSGAAERRDKGRVGAEQGSGCVRARAFSMLKYRRARTGRGQEQSRGPRPPPAGQHLARFPGNCCNGSRRVGGTCAERAPHLRTTSQT